MSRISRWSWALIATTLVGSTMAPGAGLVLLDGRLLEGRSVELEEDFYFLTLDDGQVLPLPAALVREVRLDEPAPAAAPDVGSPESDEAIDATARLEADAAPPPAATPEQIRRGDDAMFPERPRLVVQLPDDGESASRFATGVLDPNWEPESESAEGPMLGVFEPSNWLGAPADPDYVLESGFEEPEGQAPFRFSRWGRPPLRSDWKPRGGFSDGDR